MDVKKKRFLIIGCFVLWGVTTLSLIVFGFPMHNRLANGVYGGPTIIGDICYISCSFIRGLYKGLSEYPSLIEFILMFIMQFLIYFLIGWIISFLIFPKKKSLHESPETKDN